LITLPQTQLASGQTLLFIGDSITDCARRDRDVPLGVGYVRMFSDLLSIREPAKRVMIFNRGIGGHTVDDLRSRWQDHVLAHQPDSLVVKIGINDINRYVTNPEAHPKQSAEAFYKIYDQIIGLTCARLPHIRILLVSPFYASKDVTEHSHRARILNDLPNYIDAVARVAQKNGTEYLDLHAAVQQLITEMPADTFAEDAIHPLTAGALFIAEQIYAALA
jgi:lysophospholipase L1-like esterase